MALNDERRPMEGILQMNFSWTRSTYLALREMFDGAITKQCFLHLLSEGVLKDGKLDGEIRENLKLCVPNK